jgi:histidinol-phosphatase (PHP family)
VLPADRHVHSEWSWDAANGAMERTCAYAVKIGVPAVAFTEHVDHDGWSVRREDLDGHEHLLPYYCDGVLTPGPLDLDGYLESIQVCRDRFPNLRIISGVELGEPHWHVQEAESLIAAGQFDLVLGSLHGLRLNGEFAEVAQLLQEGDSRDVIREYLLETERLVSGTECFSVLAHIDYPARYWDEHVRTGPFDPSRFEDEFRHVLSALAASDRALEVNTRLNPFPQIIRWWREAGGQALTFGSDAHVPTALATGFADAAALVESEGFRPGRDPEDVWHRVTA